MKKITLLLCFFVCAFSFGQSTANYDISITTIWNSTDHTSVPSNAHWSPLAGATHKNQNDILEFGAIAPLTDGIRNIAETGSTTNFQNEINANANTGIYLQQGFSPFAGNNSSASLSGVSVSEDLPYITLVSMVAPSPDWFIAINNLDLRSGNPSINNGWKETFTLDVFAYDSGTDNGTNYGSSNSVNTPRTAISMVSGFPINGNRMATITFTYNSSTLSTEALSDLTIAECIKIFPNPTDGNISISNAKNLKSIEIYNVLGNLVEQIDVKQNPSTINLNLSQMNKGIYLLKTEEDNGTSNTQKLVIN